MTADSSAFGRRVPSPSVFISPWVSLSGVSPTAQALYFHLVMGLEYRASLTSVAALVGMERADIEPYLAELAQVDAVTQLGDGGWAVHDQPRSDYAGPTNYWDVWEALPSELDLYLAAPGPPTPKTPNEQARAAFARSRGRRQLRREIAAGEHTCVTCGASDDLTVDHIVPLAAGGGNEISNLRVLCRSCNCRKGTRSA